MTPLSLATLASLDPATLVALAAIFGLVVVLVVAFLRPSGPVTIHARDINVRHEARVKVE